MPRPGRKAAIILLVACTYGACRSRSEPSAPEAQPDAEIASGPQRIEWDQPALEGTDVASYRFVLHGDGLEHELAATCGEVLPSGSHLCSAELPALGAGRHVLTLAAINDQGGKRLESRRSVSLVIETR